MCPRCPAGGLYLLWLRPMTDTALASAFSQYWRILPYCQYCRHTMKTPNIWARHMELCSEENIVKYLQISFTWGAAMLMNLKYRVFQLLHTFCLLHNFICVHSKFRCLKGESTKDMREKWLNKKVCANICLFENNININLNININIKINNNNKLKSVSFSFFLQFSFLSTIRHF